MRWIDGTQHSICAVALAIAGSAAATLGAGALGASAAQGAASTQAAAAQNAAALQNQQFNTTLGNLSPFINAGQTGISTLLGGNAPETSAQISQAANLLAGANPEVSLQTIQQMLQSGNIGGLLIPSGTPLTQAQLGTESNIADLAGRGLNLPAAQGTPTLVGPGSSSAPSLLSQLIAPFNPTQAQLEQTPGYQFTLAQGLKQTQNQLASEGLAQGGPEAAGIAQYTTGLASQTFQQQFQNYWTQNQNIFNELMGLSGLGETAAAGQGALGAQTQNSLSSLITGAANAQAAGQIGTANAATGAASGLSSNALLLALLTGSQNQAPNALLQQGTGAGTAGGQTLA